MQPADPQRAHGRRSAGRRLPTPAVVMALPLPNRIALGLMALALIAGLSIAPTQRAQAAVPTFDERIAGQTMKVAPGVTAQTVVRDGVAATDGVQTLANNGTNADWAKLVLLFGGWPKTEENVTVILRWMRQENGPPDWWNRNNPLNNGYGSGGGAGLGSYPDLVTAARYCAENLHRGYPEIVAGLAAGSSADATAQAIWASPWASSHYANGAHWSTRPVEIVQAPADAW
ncbi:hypothetical protein [Leifsonia poae]|nr:hypothetical protein [Leifsonia poae]